MRRLVEFCKWQTCCGRFRWTVAVLVVLVGLIGAATGTVVLIAAAAVPCVVAVFWLVISWEWQIVMEPWVVGMPQLRRPLLALSALHWLGPAILPFLEPGGDGHGPYAPDAKSTKSEPLALTAVRYNWLGSLAVMAAILWVMAVGWWVLRQVLPGQVWNGRSAAWKLAARQCVSVAVVLLYAVLTIIGTVRGYATPRVVDVTMPLQGLPECLSGYTVAMLSDLHAGPLVGRAEVARLVVQLNALNADVEVLVGDIADGPPKYIADELAPLADLDAPDGAFFVTGNHEYFHGSTGSDWIQWFDRELVQVIPLNDTGVVLPRRDAGAASRFSCSGNATFDLLGVNDFGQGDHISDAILSAKAKLSPSTASQVATPDRASLLLAHQPRSADGAAGNGVGGVVSGHTHGGQVWPIHWTTYIGNNGRVAGGFEVSRSDARVDESILKLQLYVGEGAVGWGPRVRLWATTEITRITLVPAESAAAPAAVESNSSHPSQFGGTFGLALMVLSTIFVCGSRMRAGLRDYASMRASARSSSGISAVERPSSPAIASKEGGATKSEGQSSRAHAIDCGEP